MTTYAYVGSRTTRQRNARGEGISIFKFDAVHGTLEPVDIVRDLVNPSFLTLSRDGRFLYTVHGDAMEVSAFAADRATGRLRFLNQQSTCGQNPVHLALDASGKFLVVSNHIGASLAVLPVNTDGTLAAVAQLVALDGPPGPHRVEQTQAKPHANPFDPAGGCVIVPDKGLDRIHCFRFDNGRLVPGTAPFVTAREATGPRHLVFHPQAAFAYVVNELDSTVTAYHYDATHTALTPLQIVSTLPDSFTGNSRAAEIAIDPQGRFLYASNRGADSIAIFAIDATSGRLHFLASQTTGGKTPRFFTLSPDGRFLFALNEDSDTIVTLAVDADSGLLTPTGACIASASPVCMVFSP